MSEHRQEFQQELDAIEARVIEMFAMLAEDLTRATDALLTGNNEVVKLLAEREQVIEALYPELEATGQPVTSCSRRRSPPTCVSCCPCCASCPSSSAPTSLVEHIARRADHF